MDTCVQTQSKLRGHKHLIIELELTYKGRELNKSSICLQSQTVTDSVLSRLSGAINSRTALFQADTQKKLSEIFSLCNCVKQKKILNLLDICYFFSIIK